MGRETTEKAHDALKWLISRQAFLNGEKNEKQVILTWNVRRDQPPKQLIGCDSVDLYDRIQTQAFRKEEGAAPSGEGPADAGNVGGIDLGASFGPDEIPLSTGSAFADQFKKVLTGHIRNLDGWERSAVIGLDSATQGRLSIFYYRELSAKDLFDRILRWHTSCIWLYTHHKKECGVDSKGKPVLRTQTFLGAASPRDIVEAAYSRNVDDKLKKSAVQRLLPCILDGAPLPADIVSCAVRRATASITMEPWEAKKTRAVACSLIRKYYNDKMKREEWSVKLDKTKDDRSYLFGRALAYARKIEEHAQWMSGNDPRQTNAERRQVIFTHRPMHTWNQLYEQLSQGYLVRFRGKKPGSALGKQYDEELNHIIALLGESGDFNDDPLSPLYLLGYQSQLDEFVQRTRERKQEFDAKQAQDRKEGTEE